MERGENRAGANTSSLAQIIADFLEHGGCCCDELNAFANLTLGEAIKKAALARDDSGELFAHQKKLAENFPHVFAKAELILRNCTAEIEACKDFDTLHKLIKKHLNFRGAGELYWYDTALRIGVSRNLMPQKVYLHRGTRKGAEALDLTDEGTQVLEMGDVLNRYPEFGVMKPYQVEDFLCLKKSVLHGFMRPR